MHIDLHWYKAAAIPHSTLSSTCLPAYKDMQTSTPCLPSGTQELCLMHAQAGMRSRPSLAQAAASLMTYYPTCSLGRRARRLCTVAGSPTSSLRRPQPTPGHPRWPELDIYVHKHGAVLRRLCGGGHHALRPAARAAVLCPGWDQHSTIAMGIETAKAGEMRACKSGAETTCQPQMAAGA